MELDEGGTRYEWARETFGGLEAGSRARTGRAVAMAAAIAAHPSGTVTQVFKDLADREGAYRLLSNVAVTSRALTQAMGESTAQACAEHRRVFVAIDGSTLSLRDRARKRDIGGVGDWKHHGRGMQVISALALDEDGVPVGLCAQTWWARTTRSKETQSRLIAGKETRFFLATLVTSAQRLRDAAPDTRAVFVMDRGFDCWPILEQARHGVRMIVRSEYDRRLIPDDASDAQYLRAALKDAPSFGHYVVDVPARDGRPARRARMSIRARRVTVELKVTRKGRVQLSLNAVLAREIDGPPGCALSWSLLTTESIGTREEILDIVLGYTMRWRIEEMHRAWKRGGCNVEQTQLRSREGIIKWATLHAAVATRAVRLTRLARERPLAPASDEFTQDEIDAAIMLRKRRTTLKIGSVPPLADVVRLIADLGGYTGKSSGGPPGPTVIARGLEQVATAAAVVALYRQKEADDQN
jgi:hypothetical protein